MGRFSGLGVSSYQIRYDVFSMPCSKLRGFHTIVEPLESWVMGNISDRADSTSSLTSTPRYASLYFDFGPVFMAWLIGVDRLN